MHLIHLLKLSLVNLTLFWSCTILADIAVLSPENKSVELFIDYKITHTPSIPENGLIGYLVRANPPDACSKIAPPPKWNGSHQINFFVLADRAASYLVHCSNRDKIRNAANAGYRAIILFSPNENFFQSSLAYYSLDHSNSSIPAVLVSHDDGELLNKRYLYQNSPSSSYKIFITSDLPPNLSYYLLPFAIVIGVCLLLTISFMIFQLIRCVQERRKAQRHRLSRKYLKKLPLQKFEKGGAGIYYETCAICLDDYINGEKIRILPCNHAYHQKCIDPWLTKSRRVCPVCKAKVKLPGMPDSEDSDSDNERQPTNTEEANERTHLLPSTSSRSGRSRSRNLGRMLLDARNDAMSSIPSTSRAFNQASTSRYQPLDDTMAQPGPSSSAPVVSELSSRRTRRKRPPNLQVVAAEIAPLIAPPQLSINCDSDSDRPMEASNHNVIDNADLEHVNPSVRTAQPTGSGRPSKRPSVDHIV